MDRTVKLIEAIEKTCGINICFHDYSGQLAQHLSRDRLQHCGAFCKYIKSRFEDRCKYNDARNIQVRFSKDPEGFLKLCHAGVIECVIPLSVSGLVPDV